MTETDVKEHTDVERNDTTSNDLHGDGKSGERDATSNEAGDERSLATDVIGSGGDAPADSGRSDAAKAVPRGVIDGESPSSYGENARDEVPHVLDGRRVRARLRPRAILLVWAWNLACSFLLATPIHTWARRVWGAHADGDSVIFRPGGHSLLTWLGDAGPGLAIVSRTTVVLFVASILAGQIVTGALIASLATGAGKQGRAPRTSFALRVGLASFSPLVAIGVVFGAMQAALIGLGLFASSATDRALVSSLGDARSFTARLVVLGVFVVAALLVGIVADFVRVTVVRELATAGAQTRSRWACTRSGIGVAVRAAQRTLGRATIAWTWRATLALGALYAGALASDLVGGRGGAALWLLFFSHQLVLLARTTLRASWFANALRLVADESSRPLSG